MTNLLALCKTPNGATVKRVQISQPLQDKIAGLFQQQAIEFMDSIEEEVEFGSDWKPDANEILVTDAPAEFGIMQAALDGNLIALPTINAANFLDEGIKGLFVALNGDNRRILVQGFTAQQVLSRKFALLLQGDTFRELTEPSFTLENYLVAVIENGRLKFKSFYKVKRIFELTQVYQEATDQQIDGFCAHASLEVGDVAAFKGVADQGVRKLVHAVSTTRILDKVSVEDIAAKAAAIGLILKVTDGQIIVPADRKSVKELLRFLDDAIYEAPLSAKRYVTNSKRPYS
jgi:hypothetical protein